MPFLAGDAPLIAGLASAAVPLIAGWPISGLLPWTLRRSFVSRLGAAWLLGAAWCGTAALAASRAGGLSLGRTTFLPIVLLPLLVAALAHRRSLSPGPARRATAAGTGAGVIAGISGAVLLVGALTTPVLDWDGRMTWSPQARLIRMERTATPASSPAGKINCRSRWPGSCPRRWSPVSMRRPPPRAPAPVSSHD